MLRFEFTYNDKTSEERKDVLAASLDCELDVPADSLVLACPFDPKLRETDRVRAFDGDNIVFEGQADEITNEIKPRGMITRLSLRSLAAGLLDNEAEPVMYINPSAEMIFTKHLKPYGIKSYKAGEPQLRGTLRIGKGMTHWQVYENFCRNAFGAVPKIDSEGTAWFGGVKKPGLICFGNDGLGYFSVKEKLKRCKLISAVRVKLNDTARYTGVIKNELPEAENIERVRLVDAVADKSSIETADKIIAHGNRESYILELECAGCCSDLLGREAKLDDNFLGVIEGLIVSRVKFIADSKGERSYIELRKL